MWRSPLAYIREQSDSNSKKIPPDIKPAFTVDVYFFSSVSANGAAGNTLCHLVQGWTQHFEIPPSAPHPTGMMVNQTGSSLSLIFPGNIFSVDANKKWTLAEITVVYTKFIFSLFLFFMSCKNMTSPQHHTAVHSTNSFQTYTEIFTP